MSQVEKVNHPELDTFENLDHDGTQKLQSLVGSIQWFTPLGRLDVNSAFMKLASFRTDPREGHLDRARRVISCPVKFKHVTIRI